MRHAPELIVSEWLNTTEPLSLASLRGRVVLIKAFQMLCPGCVSHALPQAQEVASSFPKEDLVVLGLHTVFEHHEAQGTRAALEAFLHEYRITFPVGIDAASDDSASPQTMTAYQMRGTPTSILIDRQGKLRKQKFGRERDLILGAEIATLLQESDGRQGVVGDDDEKSESAGGCDSDGCEAPNG